MDVTHDDLAWDYTADECSPLLRRDRHNQPCSLTRNQAQYLLHSLSEAVQILNAELRHRDPDDGRAIESVPARSRIYILYHRVVRYFPVVTITLQILAVLIDTVIDASLGNHADTVNKPYTSAVFVSVGAALTILFYVDLMHRFLYSRVAVVTLLATFISSAVLFANIYAVFNCFDKSVWSAHATNDAHELYVITFLRMVHVSISVFTFSQDASGTQVKAWYPLTVLSIQMLLAYGHLLIIIVTIFGSFLPRTHSVISSSHVECSPLQPDTDSLSFGTHLTNVVNSNPMSICVRDGLHSEQPGAALLSNSI